MGISTKLKAFSAMRKMDNGWKLILDRLLFPAEPIQVCRYKGLEFITDLSAGEANGAREILTSDEYSRFLGSMELEGGLRVLDIGANNGGFPLLLASEGCRFESLVSVELNPSTVSRLRFNLERNFGSAAKALNAAVCGEEREIRFRGARGSTSDSIFTENGSGEGNYRSVQGVTLDDLIEDEFGDATIDVCKIDVEGAEFEIFRGGHFSRIRQCRNILIEIHHFPETPRSEVRDAIEAQGFEEVSLSETEDELHHVHLFRRRGNS